MKLSERITLLKAGYSKKEIDALAEAEAKEAEENKEDVADKAKAPDGTIEDKEPVGVDKYMDVIDNLANEVKELKNNIYQNNINSTEIKGSKTLQDEAKDILASIINPINKKEEE